MLLRFKSFISLLDYCGIMTDLPVGQIKKIVLAEFSQSDTGFLEVNGVVYNKQEVLDWLDASNASTILEYHKTIDQHKDLLSFLEKDTFSFDRVGWYNLSDDADFVSYISPYYGFAYARRLNILLKAGLLLDAGNFLLFHDFISPQDREQSYLPLQTYYSENVRLLKNMSQVNFRDHMRQINPWVTQDWQVLFNQTPNHLRQEAVELGHVLLSFGINMQRVYRHWTAHINTQLFYCQIFPTDFMNVVRNNQNALEGNDSSPKSNWSGREIVLIVVFVIKFLLLISRCS